MTREDLKNAIYNHFTMSVSFIDKRFIVNDILKLFNIDANYHILNDSEGSLESLTDQLVDIIQPIPKKPENYIG